MMRLKVLAAILLTITVIALGGVQPQDLLRYQRRGSAPGSPWDLLGTPRFKTLQGKIQVTVFLPEGARSWTAELW
ncbi:MAG: hypothetical protein ACK4I8_02055, partial [Armatimonadota bacterium]